MNGAKQISHSGSGTIISGSNPTTSSMTISCSVTNTSTSGTCSITTPSIIANTNYEVDGWGTA